MLDRCSKRVDSDVIGPGHVAYGVEGVWEGLLQSNDVLNHCCGGGEVASTDFTWRAGLGLVVGG